MNLLSCCPKAWAYPDDGTTRDLRLDFMRGFVIPLLFATHFQYFSALMYIGWERVGVISMAEIFVTLSGIVTGLVYRRKIERTSFSNAMDSLVQRGIRLYLINVGVILIVGLMRYLPWPDMTILTTFQDPVSGMIYSPYPPLDADFSFLLSQTLLLRFGPHQYQVIGLYAALFILTPLVFALLRHGQIKLLLGVSWVLYLIHYGAPFQSLRPTGAQFEYAFPVMAWQLIFVHGLVLGYYKDHWVPFLASFWGKVLIKVSVVLSIGFLLFAWNHPMDQFPEWAQFHWVPPDTFMYLYNTYFEKSKLGIGRLLNMAVAFISVYILLTYCWRPINRLFGWFFIPLGQASLYVFTTHLIFLLIIANTPLPEYHNFWLNTLIHAIILACTWIMVKTRFLFRFIPH